jgi:hypothetical protein
VALLTAVQFTAEVAVTATDPVPPPTTIDALAGVKLNVAVACVIVKVWAASPDGVITMVPWRELQVGLP